MVAEPAPPRWPHSSQSWLEVFPKQDLRDASRLRCTFEFEGHVDDGLDATRDFLDLLEKGPEADAGADRDRCWEPYTVQSVVDDELRSLEVEDLGEQWGCQRKHQVPLGDRLAERSVLGPLDVDVNPLVVVGGVREAVYVVLRDLVPVAVAEVRAGLLLELVDPFQQGDGHRLSSCEQFMVQSDSCCA